jgi:hypothetical protein
MRDDSCLRGNGCPCNFPVAHVECQKNKPLICRRKPAQVFTACIMYKVFADSLAVMAEVKKIYEIKGVIEKNGIRGIYQFDNIPVRLYPA